MPYLKSVILLWKCLSEEFQISGVCVEQHFISKIRETVAAQWILCSSDPLDQSRTADLRLLSLFILCVSASARFPLQPPPFALLPSSLFYFFLLCHCSSMWRWADACVVRGSTPRAQHYGKCANLFLSNVKVHSCFNEFNWHCGSKFVYLLIRLNCFLFLIFLLHFVTQPCVMILSNNDQFNHFWLNTHALLCACVF